ncbi:MAG: hypothetical protein AB7H70_13325 [Rhodospirillaceae bacterium]
MVHQWLSKYFLIATDADAIPRETAGFAQLRAKIGHPAIRFVAVFGKQGAKRGMVFDADGGNPGWRRNTIQSDQKPSSKQSSRALVARLSPVFRSRIVGVFVSHIATFVVAPAGLL